MTTITDEQIIAIARLHQQYEQASKQVTLRGPGIVEFVRALLAEHERQTVAALLSVRAALDGDTGAPT